MVHTLIPALAGFHHMQSRDRSCRVCMYNCRRRTFQRMFSAAHMYHHASPAVYKNNTGYTSLYCTARRILPRNTHTIRRKSPGRIIIVIGVISFFYERIPLRISESAESIRFKRWEPCPQDCLAPEFRQQSFPQAPGMFPVLPCRMHHLP